MGVSLSLYSTHGDDTEGGALWRLSDGERKSRVAILEAPRAFPHAGGDGEPRHSQVKISATHPSPVQTVLCPVCSDNQGCTDYQGYRLPCMPGSLF